MEGKEEEAKRRMMMKIKLKETEAEINQDDIKRQEAYNMSPRVRRGGGGGGSVGMSKSSSVRQNCLCAPTTHPGSFRCRYHRRNAGLGMSRGISVPSNLSMLGGGDSISGSPK
ncbi:unnamed protein product [Arabidopsis lyrata]|uniref:Uncharacterized protein n=1 Tax=Arabidopsis lyrata subsp. lyrata TaxID=81972 RepID=D7L1B9_ARALL|nr:uncharacterized protein LOC9318877 [Arabidopsis lyrata subsp. lyrata]EFH59070.1 hypothetical protein ARALYDRAFT_478705 [Arabidopsis lyrata subsp. lyrata]CAH8260303.1 unnamed protein product [Arabidopsis lyrata]|eukprot:XP_020888530.1 uncharacterized protein LOC9318877 [Arabidopsis lyrata subsp. lyrata]